MAHPKTMVIEIANVTYVFERGGLSSGLCNSCCLAILCSDPEDRRSIDMWRYCGEIESKTGHMYNCQEVINGRY